MRKISTMLLCLLLVASQLLAQNKTVTGKVLDEKGVPVANVSVLVKGTTIGTTSKQDGSFSISVSSSAKILVISSVNFTSQEVPIKGASVSVTLQSSTASLDEVVVVAYGTQKKETLTGSVGTISAENLKTRAISNITNSIEGAIPGVVVGSANGQPGSGNSIRIRGFGSINATSEPLFVVDGVPYTGGSSNINPDDVESTTILKDASATALYGSRAANGVVIITTKKGKKGRNNISVRGQTGFSTRGLQEYERLDPFQFYPVQWDMYKNSLIYPVSGTGISADSASRVASGLTNRTSIFALLGYNPFNVANNAIVSTSGSLNPNAQLLYPDDLDWTKELMRTGIRQDYSINFNGGAEKSDYFVSLGFLNDKGYTVRSDLKRYTARINVNVQPKSWIKAGLNISGNFSQSNTASDGGSTSFVNPFFFSRNIGPIYPVYAHNPTTGNFLLDASGNKFWDLGNLGGAGLGLANRPTGGFSGRHTLAETTLNEQFFNRTVASARNYVDLIITKNFKFTNNVSVDFQSQYDGSYENTVVGDGAPAGRSSKEYGGSTGLTTSQLLNYNNKFGSHTVDVLGGHEVYNLLEQGQRGFRQGQSLSGNIELNNFTTVNAATSYTDRYRIESYFSRLNYDYKSKYYVSGSIRRDGNSRFSQDARWGTFWSVGGGWNIDKESFFKVNWVNQLKIRSSYGVVGVADGIGFYAYQGLYGFANNANEPGIVQSQTSFLNRELTWEVNKQFDLGLEFSLFKNRLSGTIEYYKRNSEKLLFAVPQPLSSGALTVTQNTATLYNKGIELQLSGDVVKTKNFTFNLNLNLSTVENRITAMPPSVSEFITGTKKYAVGASIFDYWLRSYYGVDPEDGAALYVSANKLTVANRRFITRKDGAIDTVTTSVANGQFAFHGSSIPDFYGSLKPTITYKNFSVSVLFTFQKGGLTYDALYQSLMSSTNYGGAQHVDILNRWKAKGDITNIPRVDAGRAVDFNATSSRWLVDASYFNIRTVTMSYSLPKSLSNKLNIQNAQFFMTAENLAFFSKRIGMNNQQAFSGVTSNAYPPARAITVGLSLNL